MECPHCGSKSFAEWLEMNNSDQEVQEAETSLLVCLVCDEVLPDRRG